MKARKQLLTLTIEIAEGQTETILIHEGDSASELARSFCHKYGLEQSLHSILVQQIQDNMD
jgi:hypothetical protein